jgi:NADPH2:quinone reductase
MNSVMQAVRCHRFAGLDSDGKPRVEPEPLKNVLSLDEIPIPECGPEHVLLRVNYAGVQYPDALQAQGLYQEKPELPYIPGSDVSGRVIDKGVGVNHVEIGDRVVATLRTGGLAEVVQADSASVWKAPERVPLSTCANIGRNYFAAYHSLKVIGEIGDGDLVLVDGASGGVGMAAVGLAKAMGAKVIAGVSTQDKLPFPAAAGADEVLTYGTDTDSYRRFKHSVREAADRLGHPDGVDLVIDMVQGELFEAALVSTVRPLGRLCLVGFTAGQVPIRPGLLLIKQAAVVGSLWVAWARAHPEQHQRHVREILSFLESGKLKPRVDRVFSIKEFIRAFELYEHNQGRGNTVVCLAEE